VEEIKFLGNPGSEKGYPLPFAVTRDNLFTFDEIEALGNPAITDADNKPRYTLAHHHAAMGKKFSVDEIIALGDPTDQDGKSIADYMLESKQPLTEKERFFLTSGLNSIPKCELAWQIEQGEEIAMAEVIQYPDLIERYADRLI
jgi:hypothetical protein